MENPEALDAVLKRASIRSFEKGKKIPRKILEKILLAGIRAPSAGNIQPRTMIVLKNEEIKKRVYELCENQAFMKDATVWVVVCVDLHRHLEAARLSGVEYDYTGIFPYTYAVLDASLSLENMAIAAETFGLGTVMIGSIIEHPEKMEKILKLPKHCLALSILCIGYPKKKPEIKEKWSYDVMICENRYRDISAQDVSEYWETSIATGLKRGGKKASKEEIKRICNKRNYGETYASHYKQEFIQATNEKLMKFIRKQGFLGEQHQ